MAIPIKAVPILSGETAVDFVRQAEKREEQPSPNLSPAQEERIAKVMRQMREFKFPWEKIAYYTMDKFLLEDKCLLVRVTQEVINHCQPFSCGDTDLDDFFANDAIAYEKELMGKTYC